MDDQVNLLDLNTATLGELKNLPGIGSNLAKRILATRPFASYEDLGRVSGFGRALMESLRTYATVISLPDVPTPDLQPAGELLQGEPLPVAAEPPAETSLVSESLPKGEPVTEITPVTALPIPSISVESGGEIPDQPAPILPVSEPELVAQVESVEQVEPPAQAIPPAVLEPPAEIMLPSAAEPLAAAEPPAVVEPPVEAGPPSVPPAVEMPAPPPTPPRPVTRRQLILTSAISSAATLLVSMICILGFLATMNGGLRFARLSQLQRVANRVESLNTQVTEIQGQLSELNERVVSLEGIGSRLTVVEDDVTQMRQDMEALSTQVNDFQKKIDDLSLQIDALLTRTSRFQKFLDGLEVLMQSLVQPEAP